MARDHLADPPDLPPEILWRSLLPLRPERSLPTRLRDAADIPLSVRAIPAMAEARARDLALALPDHARESAAAREVLALILHTPEGRAFPSAAALGGLEEHELGELAEQAFGALADICPTQARSNTKRWVEVLIEGARHDANIEEAAVLAGCIDVGFDRVIARPDRYWGVPFRELCDGHWLVFHAAREVFKDRK